MRNIQFDDIHTNEKQTSLKKRNAEISEQMISRFPFKEKMLACPCCDSPDIKFYTTKYGFKIDSCLECSHIFTNPFPTADALDFYYNSEFKDFENKFFAESFEGRVPIFEYRIEKLLNHLKEGSRILDVGGSIGIFLEANRRLGNPFDIDICDLNTASCKALQERYPDINVYNTNVTELRVRNYDCVTLWDTLEHIPDPASLLRAIVNLLSVDGRSLFAFSTPNTKSLEWSVMQDEHVQLLPPGHVNLYNVHNIRKVLARHGLRVNKIETPNVSLDLSYISKVFSVLSGSNKKDPYVALASEYFELLEDQSLRNDYFDRLRSSLRGGNMFVIAEVRGDK